MRLVLGSLFAGIGGFDVAAERCGLTVDWQIEIDKFARKVLEKHWPKVTRYEDIKTIDPASLASVGVLCGGWPCQGNSSAGKRKGHVDPRSGLFSEVLRLIDGMAERPRWLFLENVPGLLSVNGRRDFAEVILQLQRRGYVGCVRRLDAQFDGLAQRRKRLLFVAGLGERGIRAVQLITEGGRRYPAPRREAREDVAPTLEQRAGRSGGTKFHTSGGIVETAPAKRARSNDPHRADMAAYVTHSLTGEGFDASEDGTDRGVPLVASTIGASGAGTQRAAGMENELGFLVPLAACDTSREGMRQDGESGTLVPFDTTQITSRANGSNPQEGDACHSLSATAHPPAAAFNIRGRNGGSQAEANEDGTASSIRTPGGGSSHQFITGPSVRRLSPTECERLQGFSWLENGEWRDGWTCLCGRNNGRSTPQEFACKCPDGPRYRVLGNAAPPPMLEWVFWQIIAAERMR